MRRHWPWLLAALLPGLSASMPVLAQQAILDTAKLFSAGAVEREQYLRGPVGWPTFQEGQAGGMFFRFDPDGYARFGPTERLDQDFWEVVCDTIAAKCVGTIGPVHLSVAKDGRPLLKVDEAVPGARYRIDASGTPVVTASELSKPDQTDVLLATTRLAPLDGGDPLTVGGLETVAAYLRWIENGQADDLRFNATPRRPFPPLPAPKPVGASPPPATPAIQAVAPAVPSNGAASAKVTVPAVAPPSPAAAPPAGSPPAPAKPALPLAAAVKPSAALPAVPSVQVPVITSVQAPVSNQAAALAAARAAAPTARSNVPPAAAAPAKPAVAQKAAPVTKAVDNVLPAAAAQSTTAAPAQLLMSSAASGSTAACEPARMAPAEIQKPIDSLRGLPGVHVVTDFLIEPPALKGKLRSGIQFALESRFQAAGIHLLTEEEVKTTPGQPQLELYLTPGDPTKGCVFRVWMSLRQEVVLVRNTSIHLLTGTWGDGGVARPEASDSPELGTFTYYIDRFVTDYQTANGSTLAPAKPAPSATPVMKAQPASSTAAADTGEEVSVRAVQTLLRENGYDPGALDGQVGPLTRTAIETFESDHDLPITGLPSRVVLDRLLARRPEGPN